MFVDLLTNELNYHLNTTTMKYITLLLCFITATGYAQNVSTALNLNKSEDLRSDYPVSEVTTHVTFYNTNGTIEKKKYVATLNAQNRVISEQRFNEEGTLTERLTWQYDSTGVKNMGRKLERWHKLLGYTCETSFHEYDAKGYLVKTVEKDKNQQIFRITMMKNDEQGNTVELITTDGKGNPYGMEQVAYDYPNNTMTTQYYNNNGEMISETLGKINYTNNDDSDIQKNKQGDVIQSSDYAYEYKYDKKGNWTFKTVYKIKNGQRIKKSEFSRKIKYAD